MTLSTFALILTGVLLNTAAQLLLKAGVQPLGALSVGLHNLLPTALQVLKQRPIVLGLSFYIISVCVWIAGLSRVEVSIAYPMLSLGYVLNALAAWWLFGEALGPMRRAGVMLILAGVLVIRWGKPGRCWKLVTDGQGEAGALNHGPHRAESGRRYAARHA